MKPDPDGQPAVTKWKVMGRSLPPPLAGEVARRSPQGEGDAGGASYAPNSVSSIANPLPTPPPQAGEGADRPRGESVVHAAAPQLAWLALEPITGRTHQLRVHCAAMGFPIFGDDIYGNEASQRRARQIKFVPRADAPGLQLHAREVVVPISKNKEPVRVVAPVPPHLRARLAACGWNGE